MAESAMCPLGLRADSARIPGGVRSTRPDPTRPDPFVGEGALASHRYLGRLASATAAPSFDVACDAFGGDSGWVR